MLTLESLLSKGGLAFTAVGLLLTTTIFLLLVLGTKPRWIPATGLTAIVILSIDWLWSQFSRTATPYPLFFLLASLSLFMIFSIMTHRHLNAKKRGMN